MVADSPLAMMRSVRIASPSPALSPARRRQRSAQSWTTANLAEIWRGAAGELAYIRAGNSITAHKGARLPSPVPSGSSRSPAHLYAPRSNLRASCTRRRRARHRDRYGRVRVALLHASAGATGRCADVRQRFAAWTCTAREPLPRYDDCADEPEYVALRLHVGAYRLSHCHGKHESSAAGAGVSLYPGADMLYSPNASKGWGSTVWTVVRQSCENRFT